MGKLGLYFHTLKHIKSSQVFNRIGKKLGRKCALKAAVPNSYSDVYQLECPEDLDFDAAFLSRFSVSELMQNKVTFLHGSALFDWKSEWNVEGKTSLWNFNLHYFEYLFPLVKEWKDTEKEEYLDKTKEIIEAWIDSNPPGTQPAWAAYPVALRIVNWIGYYGYTSSALDESFKKKFLNSLHAQYVYLSNHLEKDILGNHYFEDLKSLVLAAVFFGDENVLSRALSDFKAECREEILPDGMHFELSPMYHKIILEGLLRVAIALKSAQKADKELDAYIQPMLDAAYSFESGLDRVPLFNDGGNNVAKSLDALVKVSNRYFELTPQFKNSFENSGYYIFETKNDNRKWKLIVDAGQPGPSYIPGHAHCDAMSFELFCDGKPVIVNCGTYAYQCKERGFFRSTAAHNTVMIDGAQQSQCWGEFRMSKRSSVSVLDLTENSITMEMKDQKGKKAKRLIRLENGELTIKDTSDHSVSSFIHLLSKAQADCVVSKNKPTVLKAPYAEDYGFKIDIITLKFMSEKSIDITINLNKLINAKEK